MQSWSDLERTEIDKAVSNLRHRLVEEDKRMTTIVDPLVEEAVILAKKSMFDESGGFQQPQDPKEIYFKLLKKKNAEKEAIEEYKVKKAKIKLDISKLSSDARKIYDEVVTRRNFTIEQMAPYPELFEEAVKYEKGHGLEYQIQNYNDVTNTYDPVMNRNSVVPGIAHGTLSMKEF
jgi:hypothetical protein